MTTTIAATSPMANADPPTTTAFAARIRLRRGLAATVVRIMPRRYSAVTDIVATTSTKTSPRNVPTSVWVRLSPRPAAPTTAGAMSPCAGEGDRVAGGFDRAGRWCRRAGVGGPPPPMLSAVQPVPVHPPSVVTLSKVAVARVGPPAMPARPNTSRLVSVYCGEATNRPASTVDGSPESRSEATVLHATPSTDVSPVTVSPVRVRRSQDAGWQSLPCRG